MVLSSAAAQVLEDGSLVATDGEGKQELLVGGVLNIGVRPDVAIRRARASFERAGRIQLTPTGQVAMMTTPTPAASSAATASTASTASSATASVTEEAVKFGGAKSSKGMAKESRSSKRNAATGGGTPKNGATRKEEVVEGAGRNLVLEQAGISGIDVFEDGALVRCSVNGSRRDLRARLVLDW